MSPAAVLDDAMCTGVMWPVMMNDVVYNGVAGQVLGTAELVCGVQESGGLDALESCMAVYCEWVYCVTVCGVMVCGVLTCVENQRSVMLCSLEEEDPQVQ